MTRLDTRHVAHLARLFNALPPVLPIGPNMPKHITPKRRPKAAPLPPHPDRKVMLARFLDRQADAELFMGHIQAAERLAHRASELRENAR